MKRSLLEWCLAALIACVIFLAIIAGLLVTKVHHLEREVKTVKAQTIANFEFIERVVDLLDGIITNGE